MIEYLMDDHSMNYGYKVTCDTNEYSMRRVIYISKYDEYTIVCVMVILTCIMDIISCITDP